MPIVKNTEMNFSDEKFCTIIYGLPGVGKTTLAFSAPKALLIDFDKGVKRTKAEHRSDIISINNYDELLRDIKTPEFREYETVIFDTAGQFVEMLKDWVVSTSPSGAKRGGGISLQGYGTVKQEFLRFTGELRKTHNVIFLFHAVKEKDKDGNPVFDLMCEGSAKQLVWIPTDLGAYMEIINGDRYLSFSPAQEYSAKSSYGITGKYLVPELSKGMPNNFLGELFAMARANISMENQAMAPRMSAYEKAMEEGREIMSTIVDLGSFVAADFSKIEHALTSEKELKAMKSAKAKELGLTYDKETKQWQKNT